MGLKNKRILITAGPTWVAIDSVRVISNIATGKTGLLLAEGLQRIGAKVTLLLGPVSCTQLPGKNIRMLRFNFFDELKSLLKSELLSKKYDIVIHSAAVSDYRPKIDYGQKVRAGIKNWRINLVPTEKLIDAIKNIRPSILLVGFKFAPASSKSRLINQAKILMRSSQAELIVANTVNNGSYNAYITSREKVSGAIRSRNELAGKLIQEIGDRLCQNSN